mmetsp:Transcript_107567/g.213660  ORF Transcript_107567/g.213660 Transcript_107567/m.213660 type:complete len:124 (+) Transcript_107567:293-664(+)
MLVNETRILDKCSQNHSSYRRWHNLSRTLEPLVLAQRPMTRRAAKTSRSSRYNCHHMHMLKRKKWLKKTTALARAVITTAAPTTAATSAARAGAAATAPAVAAPMAAASMPLEMTLSPMLGRL